MYINADYKISTRSQLRGLGMNKVAPVDADGKLVLAVQAEIISAVSTRLPERDESPRIPNGVIRSHSRHRSITEIRGGNKRISF